MSRKPIQVLENLHEKIRLQAWKEKLTMGEFIMKIFTKYMSTLCLLLMVSCATTYTKTDDVNYDRYEHDQKIKMGMSTREVMDMFGSPQIVKEVFHYNKIVLEFTYYRGIHCKSVYCFVHFDREDKEVINWIEFRQEYMSFLD